MSAPYRAFSQTVRTSSIDGGINYEKRNIPTGLEKAAEWLVNYDGNFSFTINVRDVFKKYHALTPKQWEGVNKCYLNDLRFKAKNTPVSVPVQDATILSVVPIEPVKEISVNADIVTTRYIAKAVKEKYKLTWTPFTYTVLTVHAETHKALEISAQITSGNVSCCRNCGKKLTDWRSIATGVGAICAKHMHIEYVKHESDVAKFRLDLEAMCNKIGTLRFWIPKACITTDRENLLSQIDNSKK